jgi:hypothetical protein
MVMDRSRKNKGHMMLVSRAYLSQFITTLPFFLQDKGNDSLASRFFCIPYRVRTNSEVVVARYNEILVSIEVAGCPWCSLGRRRYAPYSTVS